MEITHFFHAIVKDRNMSNGAVKLHDESGRILTEFEDIETNTNFL